eukprot:scaffold105089_cov32-Prasinocladus_malaysianus.AAC.1
MMTSGPFWCEPPVRIPLRRSGMVWLEGFTLTGVDEEAGSHSSEDDEQQATGPLSNEPTTVSSPFSPVKLGRLTVISYPAGPPPFTS